jgi:ATP-dependent metalloprotease FtsH
MNDTNFGAGVGGGMSPEEYEMNDGMMTPGPSVVIDMLSEKSERVSPFEPILGSPMIPINVRIQVDPEEQKRTENARKIQIFISLAILFVFIVSLGLSQRSSIGGAGGIKAMQNNANRSVGGPTSLVKFSDIQGCDEVKRELEQIVDFLRNPEKYEKFGATMPRGYLLSGPPGVGKTMLAKAVAGEAGVNFISISGSEFDEIYVGVGAARVRGLFTNARQFGKAVIFIDEIDAVAGKRSDKNEHGALRQTLNQLLTEMDGFKGNTGIVVLAATNTPASLDPAILRPGRFDKTLTIAPPDVAGREKIVDSLLAKIKKEVLAGDVKARDIAVMTIGFTGADLANLVNRAKLLAATDASTKTITMGHFKKALEYINYGPERIMALSEEQKKLTAFHEAGHAIVALASAPHAFPVQYATIVPHSEALGLVFSAPDTDIHSMSLAMLKARLDMSLAGFAAELRLSKDNMDMVTTGAASDFEAANKIARSIVHAGFGTKCSFFQPMTEPRAASESAKKDFEDDVREIIHNSNLRVLAILQKFEKAWKAIAEALIEKETLSRAEIEKIYAENNPDRCKQ